MTKLSKKELASRTKRVGTKAERMALARRIAGRKPGGTGYRGVRFDQECADRIAAGSKEPQLWLVTWNSRHLAYTTSPEEAARIWDQAAIKALGSDVVEAIHASGMNLTNAALHPRRKSLRK